jgi:hypothetical protein
MPLFVIILAQISLNFNLSTLQVSVDGTLRCFVHPSSLNSSFLVVPLSTELWGDLRPAETPLVPRLRTEQLQTGL